MGSDPNPQHDEEPEIRRPLDYRTASQVPRLRVGRLLGGVVAGTVLTTFMSVTCAMSLHKDTLNLLVLVEFAVAVAFTVNALRAWRPRETKGAFKAGFLLGVGGAALILVICFAIAR